MSPRSVRDVILQDTPVTISRTGYTGEHAMSSSCPQTAPGSLGHNLSAGADKGLLPAASPAGNILRMETGHLLYGNDLDETRTPLESRLVSFVDFKKEFIGKEALLRLQAEGPKQKLIGFILVGAGIPRSGGSIFSESSRSECDQRCPVALSPHGHRTRLCPEPLCTGGPGDRDRGSRQGDSGKDCGPAVLSKKVVTVLVRQVN